MSKLYDMKVNDPNYDPNADGHDADLRYEQWKANDGKGEPVQLTNEDRVAMDALTIDKKGGGYL
jgi:hypothetical protein